MASQAQGTYDLSMRISYETPDRLPVGPYVDLQAATKSGTIHCTPSLTIQQVHDMCIKRCLDHIATQKAGTTRAVNINATFKILQMCYHGAFIDMVAHGGQTLESFHVESGQLLMMTMFEVISMTMNPCVVCALL